MKLIKIEVIEGCVHHGKKVYIKGDKFEIDENYAKSLIKSKVCRQAVIVKPSKQKSESKTDGAKTNETQEEIFEKIDDDLSEKSDDNANEKENENPNENDSKKNKGKNK
jgi:hypothetical protein